MRLGYSWVWVPMASVTPPLWFFCEVMVSCAVSKTWARDQSLCLGLKILRGDFSRYGFLAPYLCCWASPGATVTSNFIYLIESSCGGASILHWVQVPLLVLLATIPGIDVSPLSCLCYAPRCLCGRLAAPGFKIKVVPPSSGLCMMPWYLC